MTFERVEKNWGNGDSAGKPLWQRVVSAVTAGSLRRVGAEAGRSAAD